jgi:nicotinate-nucleotide pyrophosphorylase (carboxylating)
VTLNLSEIIRAAFVEDLPRGDLTTDQLGLGKRLGKARLIAKEDLVLAGAQVFTECIHFQDPEIELHWQLKDGDLVLNQQTVAWLKGDLLQILRAERVSLNFLGRLSGIATLTRCFVQETAGTTCKILDTRKTTPGLRALEKMAVRAGGGTNHRMDLSSAILIKDNHIRAVGSIQTAIHNIRKTATGPIEVECRTLTEVKAAVEARVARILLDNMNDEQLREARAIIPAVIEVEASGNMTVDRIKSVAALGVDFISVGAITHSAPCADLSLMFEWPSE